jgi:primary-amine oxidase
VLQQANLAQIEVHYDDGLANLYPLSNPGLGDSQLLTLSAADCPNGVLQSQGNRALLCKQVVGRGYLHKYYAQQQQGDELTIFSVSQIGQQLYIVQWRFFEDGMIEPHVGEGGRLLRQGGYITNYWWRLNFDLGGNGANDLVEEFEVNPANSNTQRVSTATALNSESSRSTDPDKKRSWRVRDGVLTNSDGHAISYHIDPKQVGYRDAGSTTRPWNEHDFYVTVAHPCEALANHNPTTSGCTNNIAGFVNGEGTAGADIVVWYRVTAHREPSAEDNPLLEVEWQGFQLLPRDWTAQSPF